MALVTRFCHLCNRIFIIYSMTTTVAAEQGIHWGTVGVAWTFSFVTTIIIIAIFLAVVRCERRRKRKIKKNIPRVTPNYARELSVVSVSSDVTHASHGSNQSTTPIINNGGGNLKPTTALNRRRRDYVSQWCDDHGLAEVVAANLRESGFNSSDQLNALKPVDVDNLGLPSLALQVQLRNVLENLRRGAAEEQHNVSAGSGSVAPLYTRRGEHKHCSRSSTTEEVSTLLPQTTPSPNQPSSSHSSVSPSFVYPVQVISEEPHPLARTEQTYPISNRNHGNSHRKPRKPSFHGLLSDGGLYTFASHMGIEWRHLSAELGLNHIQVEHIVHDNPGDMKNQIATMLRCWRDRASGDKEQVKAELMKGLTRIKRRDLADMILKEEVHGSNERIPGTIRVNSVV